MRDDKAIAAPVFSAVSLPGIECIHKRTRETCGPKRLQEDLADNGVKAGVSRIRRIRKKLGIKCKQKKRFKATTDSRHNLPVAENLLGQKFEATAPNKVWVSDITYIPTEQAGGDRGHHGIHRGLLQPSEKAGAAGISVPGCLRKTVL